MPVEEHHRDLPLQHPHHLGYCIFRWYPYADVYVVYADRSPTSSSLYISSSRFMTFLISALHSPYKTFLRYFGINTMWYVQSHFVCAELSSCIFVSCVLSEMRCYRFSTLPKETFSCLITIRVKRFAAPQA